MSRAPLSWCLASTRLSGKLKISGTKSMTGHLLGGAGGLEAGITVLALINQVLPPTINLDNVDPECRLDYVANKAIKHSFDVALSNSFGFGGINATLIMRRWRIKAGTRDQDQGVKATAHILRCAPFVFADVNCAIRLQHLSDDGGTQLRPAR